MHSLLQGSASTARTCGSWRSIYPLLVGWHDHAAPAGCPFSGATGWKGPATFALITGRVVVPIRRI